MTHRIAPPGRVMAFPRKTDCATTAPMPTARPWRRGQAPQPRSGAPKAPGLTAAITVAAPSSRPSIVPDDSTRADTPIKAFATSRIYTSLTDTTPRRYPRRWSTAPTGEIEPERLSLPNGVAFSSLARRTWSKIADGPVLRRGTHARTVGSRRLHPDPVRQILAAGPRPRASKAHSWSRSRRTACGPGS